MVYMTSDPSSQTNSVYNITSKFAGLVPNKVNGELEGVIETEEL